MAKYLINPIYAYKEIKDNFLLYVKTAFGTRYESIEKERESLLRSDQVSSREPWIEPLPSYENIETEDGKKLKISTLRPSDLPGMNDSARQLFKELINKGLISKDYPIYRHQAEMLQKALTGKNCIITSGTGSGKTEAFMLPMLADIIAEAEREWTQPISYDENAWWRANNGAALTKDDIFVFPAGATKGAPGLLGPAAMQRPNERRTAAVRALIIYPMNALVEDQMTRLRDALDNDDVQDWMKSRLNGNRIFFGRYNGATPTSGYPKYMESPVNSRIYEDLLKAMRNLESTTNDTLELLKTNGYSEKEIKKNREKYKTRRTISQMSRGANGIPSSEMRSRFDMQQTPPDILITNYSMLAMMLMREVDNPIIEKTRAWLMNDPWRNNQVEKPQHIFHLVIDELHLNRGTSGTETAYLIRLLLKRLGLTPDSPQLRILSSSASLEMSGEKKDESLRFLKNFFGCEFTDENIVEGHFVKLHQNYASHLPTAPFVKIYNLFYENPLCFEEYASDKQVKQHVDAICHEAAQMLAEYAICPLKGDDGVIQLLNVISSDELAITKRLSDIFDLGDIGHNRALPFCRGKGENESPQEWGGRFFASSLFGTLNEEDSTKAAEGFIIVRGLFDLFDKESSGIDCGPMQRFRFHLFYRNIDGLWATLEKYDEHNNKPVGKLHAHSLDIDGEKRVLELLYCEQCGTVFYGGKRHAYKELSSGKWITDILPTSSNLEALPERQSQVMVEKRCYHDYALFYPIPDSWNDNIVDRTLHEQEVKLLHKLGFGKNDGSTECFWQLAFLDEKTGNVTLAESGDSHPGIRGFLYVVPSLDGEQNEPAAKAAPALPCHCPYCATSRFGKAYRSPIRGFRTGFNKVTQLYAREFFYQLPTQNNRKLVTFADSRQDAANVANSIEREQFTDLMRDIVVEKCTLDESIDYSAVQKDLQELRLEEEKAKETLSNPLTPMFDIRRTKRVLDSIQAEINDLKNILSRTISVQDLISPNDCFKSPVFKAFRELHANPAGCDSNNQHFEETPYSDPAMWYEVDDTASSLLKENVNKKVGKAITQNVMKVLFGRLHYNAESAGIGWVTVEYNDNYIHHVLSEGHRVDLTQPDLSNYIDHSTFIEIVNSVIRLAGNDYRYANNPFKDDIPKEADADFSNLRGKDPIRSYIYACCDRYNIPYQKRDGNRVKLPNTLGQAVIDYLKMTGNKQLFLQPHTLRIRCVSCNDLGYICPRCGRVHLHKSAGICSGCFRPLDINNSTTVCFKVCKMGTGECHYTIC